MKRKLSLFVAALFLTALASRVPRWNLVEQSPLAQASQDIKAPMFQFDATWPKALPEKWAIGPVVGVAVDLRDHIWIVHRVSALSRNERYTAAAVNPPQAECCVPAPPVLEFDQAGNLVSSWGGSGVGYEWPQSEHGIFVDYRDNVWLAANGANDSHVLKFTREGKFVQQLGIRARVAATTTPRTFGWRPTSRSTRPTTKCI